MVANKYKKKSLYTCPVVILVIALKGGVYIKVIIYKKCHETVLTLIKNVFYFEIKHRPSPSISKSINQKFKIVI